MDRAGFQVTVVTSGVQYMTGKDIRAGKGWCTEEWVDGTRILRTWAPTEHRRSMRRRICNYLSYACLAGLACLFRVGKADYVFAGTDPIFMLPMVYALTLIKGAPMVLDERDLYPDDAITMGIIREGWLSRLMFKFMQFFRRRAASLLTATPEIRKRLVSYGCPEAKVHLLVNADAYLDEDIDLNYPRSLREETGKAFLIGYAGGLGPSNNILTLLQAMECLRDLDELGLVIIGQGECLTSYQTYCLEHDLQNVYFIGVLPRRQARSLLRQLDVCLHLLHAKDEISLPSKIFDYQGLGKPMIFSGRGDTVDLLQASGGGIVVSPEDEVAMAMAIRRLLADVPLREQMGIAARQWFEQHIGVDTACAILKTTITQNYSK